MSTKIIKSKSQNAIKVQLSLFNLFNDRTRFTFQHKEYSLELHKFSFSCQLVQARPDGHHQILLFLVDFYLVAKNQFSRVLFIFLKIIFFLIKRHNEHLLNASFHSFLCYNFRTVEEQFFFWDSRERLFLKLQLFLSNAACNLAVGKI